MQLETEQEKIFPFDPLHCSTVPTVPVVESDEELDTPTSLLPRTTKSKFIHHPSRQSRCGVDLMECLLG